MFWEIRYLVICSDSLSATSSIKTRSATTRQVVTFEMPFHNSGSVNQGGKVFTQRGTAHSESPKYEWISLRRRLSGEEIKFVKEREASFGVKNITLG